jgi:large subunit ribosomal protein L18
MKSLKTERYERRKKSVRSKIVGTMSRPRLSVFKSNKYLYAQIIDDVKGKTLVSASGDKNKGEEIGEKIAKKALAKKIKSVIFDRNGFIYHGRIKALADGARKGGLKF